MVRPDGFKLSFFSMAKAMIVTLKLFSHCSKPETANQCEISHLKFVTYLLKNLSWKYIFLKFYTAANQLLRPVLELIILLSKGLIVVFEL